MSYDPRSYMGRADKPRYDIWGLLFIDLLLASLLGVCIWAALV